MCWLLLCNKLPPKWAFLFFPWFLRVRHLRAAKLGGPSSVSPKVAVQPLPCCRHFRVLGKKNLLGAHFHVVGRLGSSSPGLRSQHGVVFPPEGGMRGRKQSGSHSIFQTNLGHLRPSVLHVLTIIQTTLSTQSGNLKRVWRPVGRDLGGPSGRLPTKVSYLRSNSHTPWSLLDTYMWLELLE